MNNQTLSFPQEYLIKEYFSLSIKQKVTTTTIVMQLLNNEVNTSTIPATVHLLQMHLPSVLRTTCYNDNDIPFHIEVKQTEIGHLFEHILLEYLCQLKIAKGFRRATFSGRTRWNWIKDPRGKFHIRVTCGAKDSGIFPLAIKKTIRLMKIILQSGEDQQIAQQLLTGASNGIKNGNGTRNQ